MSVAQVPGGDHGRNTAHLRAGTPAAALHPVPPREKRHSESIWQGQSAETATGGAAATRPDDLKHGTNAAYVHGYSHYSVSE